MATWSTKLLPGAFEDAHLLDQPTLPPLVMAEDWGASRLLREASEFVSTSCMAIGMRCAEYLSDFRVGSSGEIPRRREVLKQRSSGRSGGRPLEEGLQFGKVTAAICWS